MHTTRNINLQKNENHGIVEFASSQLPKALSTLILIEFCIYHQENASNVPQHFQNHAEFNSVKIYLVTQWTLGDIALHGSE